MRAAGLLPAREAVLLLAERLEGNLLAAQQEIEKLVLLKGKGEVSEEDVLQAVADSSRFDAFILIERMLSGDLAGMRVALLDDVVTTCATVREIIRVLKHAGVVEVQVWAVARTV